MNRVSYNGGEGGINARPRPEEEAAERERHIPPQEPQVKHMQAARGNPELRALANHGKPPVAATGRPGELRGEGAVPAREAGAPYNPPANRGGAQTHTENNRPATAMHPNDIPARERPASPNTGNAKLDKKYEQQQEKLQQKQDQERQKLQQRQDQEHQRLAKQNANDARKQQTEQRHQQQTQQLQQRHEQQQQKLQQRQQPPPNRSESRPPKGKQ